LNRLPADGPGNIGQAISLWNLDQFADIAIQHSFPPQITQKDSQGTRKADHDRIVDLLRRRRDEPGDDGQRELAQICAANLLEVCGKSP
jgi:hypothetical protein